MPYTLVHDGISREFDFYAPTAWPYWVAQAWVQQGRVGLPLVIALHGAGQNPLSLQSEWFFPYVWTLDADGQPTVGLPGQGTYIRTLENQFFVLYPYGMGWASKTLQSTAYDPLATALLNLGLQPQASDERTVRGWNSGVDGVTTGPGIDDVGFIQAMIRAIDEKLRQEILSAAELIDRLTDSTFPWQFIGGPFLQERSAPETLFDRDRRFLFGYSNGGMLAHRLVRAMPDHWAAVWGMSTAVGGKPHKGVGDPEDAVVNLPEEGEHSVSFFAHHGLLDEIAPPGVEGDVLGTADFELQSPIENSPPYRQYQFAGFRENLGSLFSPDIIDGLTFLPGFLPLAQGWRGYIAYNGLSEETVARPRQGLEEIEIDLSLPGPLFGGAQPKKEGVTLPGAYSYSSGDTGLPEADYPFSANPICVMYIDRAMHHTDFTSHPDRYFFAYDIWRFFRTHPRRRLLAIGTLPPGGFP